MGTPETGSITVDIEARHAHVVGSQPRILPLRHDEANDEARKVVARLRDSAGSGKTGGLPEHMRTMLKHPTLFRCQMEMGTALFRGLIPPREREIAVLRVGWLCRAPYEWGEHVAIGKQNGLGTDDVERITAGSSAAGWNEHERAILRGVEELLADHALSDDTWETLAKSWSEAQLIEFTMLVGQYVSTAFVQNSLRVRLGSENPGLGLR